ncbi:hypothetical protein VUR80DRAFT_5778 [Thermomyces stellatus]
MSHGAQHIRDERGPRPLEPLVPRIIRSLRASPPSFRLAPPFYTERRTCMVREGPVTLTQQPRTGSPRQGFADEVCQASIGDLAAEARRHTVRFDLPLSRPSRMSGCIPCSIPSFPASLETTTLPFRCTQFRAIPIFSYPIVVEPMSLRKQEIVETAKTWWARFPKARRLELGFSEMTSERTVRLEQLGTAILSSVRWIGCLFRFRP